MIALAIGIILAALVYWLVVVLTGSFVLAVVAAVLVLLAGLATAHDRGGRI